MCCYRDVLYVVVGGEQRLELDHAGISVDVEVECLILHILDHLNFLHVESIISFLFLRTSSTCWHTSSLSWLHQPDPVCCRVYPVIDIVAYAGQSVQIYRIHTWCHWFSHILSCTNDFCRPQTVVDLEFSMTADHWCYLVVAVPSLVVGELHNVPFPVVVGSIKPVLLLLSFQLMEGPNSWNFSWIAVTVWLASWC